MRVLGGDEVVHVCWTNLIHDFVNFSANKMDLSKFQCTGFSFIQSITISLS